MRILSSVLIILFLANCELTPRETPKVEAANQLTTEEKEQAKSCLRERLGYIKEDASSTPRYVDTQFVLAKVVERNELTPEAADLTMSVMPEILIDILAAEEGRFSNGYKLGDVSRGEDGLVIDAVLGEDLPMKIIGIVQGNTCLLRDLIVTAGPITISLETLVTSRLLRHPKTSDLFSYF